MTSRRMVLAGAAVAPLLGILGQWRQARADQAAQYRIIDGWGEIRLTPQTMTALRGMGATVYAIKPATLVGDPNVATIRMPLESGGAVNHDFTEGLAAIAGGVGLRTAAAEGQLTKVSGSLRGAKGRGSLALNGETIDVGPWHVDIRKDAVITVDQGPPGRPSAATIKAPLRATPEAVDLLTRHFGVPVFIPNTNVARVSARFRFLSAG